MKAIVEYFNSVVEEMRQVTWPSKDEVVQTTTLVIAFALVLSVLIYVFDFVIGFVIGKIY